MLSRRRDVGVLGIPTPVALELLARVELLLLMPHRAAACLQNLDSHLTCLVGDCALDWVSPGWRVVPKYVEVSLVEMPEW